MFAAILLLWTTADLFDHGLCVHDHQRLGSHGRPALDAPPDGAQAASEAPDDCFCCSHGVEAGAAFRMVLADAVAWALPYHVAHRPHLDASPFYHPPLA